MKFYLKTYGCKVNQYESQVLREDFINKNYTEASDIDEADIAVINSCTVTSNADKECRQLVRKISKRKPLIDIFVTGCYAKRAEGELKEISEKVKIMKKEHLLKTVAGLSNHSRAFVKIQDGCNAFCTYCIVPYVRQKIESKPVREVIGEITGLTHSGYPEIVLCGIRLGKYAHGLNALLQEILKLEGKFRVRLSSLELEEVNDELLELMASNKGRICGHLHIPLQSGSDKILKLMNRPYTARDFLKKVSLMRSFIPEAALTTDVMVGFPGETDKDFEETVSLIEKAEFSRLHVFRYSARPDTKSNGLEGRVSPSKAHERAKMLESIDEKLRGKYLEKFIGSSREAVREEGRNSVLTDNYLSLPNKLQVPKSLGPVFKVDILYYRGKVWAEAKV